MTHKLILIQLISLPVLVFADSCDNPVKGEACTFEVKGDETLLSIFANETACLSYPDDCCWDGIQCYNKLKQTSTEGNATEAVFEFPELSGSTNATTSNGTSRRTITAGECPPSIPPSFPDTCRIERGEPYVNDPPIDIPYCKRLACSSNRTMQEELEISHFKCGSQPGCYFDKELFQIRKVYGESVLAGVPTCHVAIRKPAFHRHAEKVIKRYGFWNPYFTNCLMKTFNDDLMEENPGCLVIPAIKTFSIQPKLKGWEGINSFECRLIDGCWVFGLGCFAPVDPNQVIVESRKELNPSIFDIRYGRQKCQHVITDSPYDAVLSYHRCLSSGCAVDRILEFSQQFYLFNIGYQMSIADHWGYWKDIQNGRIASINDLKSMPWKIDFSKPIGQPDFSNCSILGESTTQRPCPPLPPPPQRVSTFCPYKQPEIPNGSNLSPLKGNFNGCCNVHGCYHPRSDVTEPRSGVAAYYTSWNYEATCTSVCGQGTRKRMRKCVSHDSSLCTEPEVEILPCVLPPCGRWSKWGPWSKCRGRAPTGTKKKTRSCIPKGVLCNGRSEITRRCPIEDKRRRKC